MSQRKDILRAKYDALCFVNKNIDDVCNLANLRSNEFDVKIQDVLDEIGVAFKSKTPDLELIESLINEIVFISENYIKQENS